LAGLPAGRLSVVAERIAVKSHHRFFEFPAGAF
jgi:hypothetical protein